MMTDEDKRYNKEVGLLDGLYEFHPGAFRELDKDDLEALQVYYCVGRDVPDDIFHYRREVVSRDPCLMGRAINAYKKLLQSLGISD